MTPTCSHHSSRTRLLILLIAILAIVVGSSGGTAAANVPPGMNMLFFSPSSSGGCGDGVISGIEEGATEPNVASPSNSPFLQPPNQHYTAAGLYANGMASTPYAPGFGGIQSGDWSTQTYFTNECSGSSQQVLVGCYTLFGDGPNICSQPGGGSGLPDPIWIAWESPSGQTVGSGIAYDAVNNIVYLTTYSNCSGDVCQVTIWSAGAIWQYGASLGPVQVATLNNVARPDYLAVDPITNKLFLMGANFNQVISVSATNGGNQTVVLPSGPLISGTVTGISVDPTTAMVYVLSAAMGDEPNQIAQVPESGAAPTSLFSGSSVGNNSLSTALAIDPANGILLWANSPLGSKAGDSANSISWGPLDGTNATTYGWFGAPDASYAAYVQALSISTYTVSTTVAATGTTASASSSGTLTVPLSTYTPTAASRHSSARAAKPRKVTGSIVVTLRDRKARRHTFGKIRTRFSLTANRHGLRRLHLPVAAQSALRHGRLEIVVQTRADGARQPARTRVLRVVRSAA
jgi:hypothetical protein